MTNYCASSKFYKRQLGFGLVEIMISITISLVIMAGVIQLFASSRQTSTAADATSNIQENMRYTMQRLGDDIYRAGNMGCLSFAAAGSPVASTSAPAFVDGVELPLGQYIFNRLFIDGDADGVADTDLQHSIDPATRNLIAPAQDANINDFEGSFISGVDNDLDNGNNILDGTDSLIVKYVDTSSAINGVNVINSTQVIVADDQTGGIGVGDVVFVGDCNGISVFNVAGVLYDAGADTSTITMRTDVGTTLTHGLDLGFSSAKSLYAGNSGSYEYFVDQSVAAGLLGNPCNAGNPLNCSLYRVSNDGVPRELIIGVSDFQIAYGYENSVNWHANAAAAIAAGEGDRVSIDRVLVTVTFNAEDNTQAAGFISRPYTRVFAVRNQL
ncbi:PilW family protein [Eionea flava]